MDVRLREHWDSLRSSYWFVPAVMTATLPIAWPYYDSLDVAGALVGIIGVVFSITTC